MNSTNIHVKTVVITREWVESAQLHPACAEFLRGVTVKTANISSYHRDSKHVEVKDTCPEKMAKKNACLNVSSIKE